MKSSGHLVLLKQLLYLFRKKNNSFGRQLGEREHGIFEASTWMKENPLSSLVCTEGISGSRVHNYGQTCFRGIVVTSTARC